MVLAGAVAVVGCMSGAGDGDAPGRDLGIAMAWLPRATPTIPPSVITLRISISVADEASPRTSIVAVGELARIDDRPRHVLGALPTERDLSVSVDGLDANGDAIYGGYSRVVRLHPGERRYLPLAMMPLGLSVALPGNTELARILPTTTTLDDGRVLIAGGFDGATELSACPASAAVGARCFLLQGSRTASLFDPATAQVRATQAPMLQARGGHAAIALDDGRVLLTGGSETAVIALEPSGDGGTETFAPRLIAEDAAGQSKAEASFELFDPTLAAETVDIDRDGDPWRGAFVGVDGGDLPGRLEVARMGHAVVRTPAADGRILLIGGVGDANAGASFEVLSTEADGRIATEGGGPLARPREVPGAVTGDDAVWIFGDRHPESQDDLAERWTPAGGPLGQSSPATDTIFPYSVAGNLGDHPELALWAPRMAAVGPGATHAVVLGWLGPYCPQAVPEPIFPPSPETPVALCGPYGGPPRGFTLDLATGRRLAATTAEPTSLGAAVRLGDGQVVVTGGIRDLAGTATGIIEAFSGEVLGGAATNRGLGMRLSRARAMHAGAPLGLVPWPAPSAGQPLIPESGSHRGALMVGGVAAISPDGLVLVDQAEVLFLPD